jgi:squalene-hopene/tetraprenyl-beta-curcumene cyclase
MELPVKRARTFAFVIVIAAAGVAAVFSAAFAARSASVPAWDARRAAAYLDQRQSWWESWKRASRDHGTVCVSCHTALPYALVRPELRQALHESDTAAAERKLVADVVTRVRAWAVVAPFYGDTTAAGRPKAIQSRGTESVLNALILASRDERTGTVSPEARQAFANMFALQKTTGDDAGSWAWLNFGLRPWETAGAAYFGAALAAVAVGREPGGYAQSAEIKPNMDRLREYLCTHLDQTLWNRLLLRDDPNLFNRAMLLWASARIPTLITDAERRAIVGALFAAQEADGAWRLASLGRWRVRAAAADSAGDGYATGLIAYALEESGTQPNEPHLGRALAWLAAHQDASTGAWPASSLNKERDPQSNVGKFMTDAATAYAALALTRAQR